VALLAVLALACGGNPPPEPPEDMGMTDSTTPHPGPTEVAPPADPSPARDVPESPLEGDLQDANQYAYEKGLLGAVYFAFDKADLDATARDRLAKNANFFKDNPSFTVTIEGHCDERGTNEYNIALGEHRASAARDYLVSLGVETSRLRTISYGEERPVCTQSSESCWQQNRRAYFLLSGRR
jgi:peptidoglycan-associated lipoprotein